ncbi:MAG: cysteine desulfurase family protein [Alphaproteobacteria bacterium]
MNNEIYLDHNATAPVREAVADAMMAALRQTGNASSVHRFGRRQRQLVETARAEVAALLGAPPQNVVFTGGGTEANNLALRGAGRKRIIVSAIEHLSVLQAADGAEIAPVTAAGIVDIDRLAGMMAADGEPALVSVMLANNETGAVQPLDDIAGIVEQAGGILHSDMVQAAGRLPLDRYPMAMATVSAHKIGGPQGIGALVLGRDVPLSPVIRGGGQERGRRAGTENMAGIVGFGVAARLAREQADGNAAMAKMRDRMEARLLRAFPDAVVFGAGAPRLDNTSCVAIPGMRAETQIMALDLAGIAVSAGSACSSGKVTTSHVLQAMGVAADMAQCAIRISFGPGNSDADSDRLIDILRSLRGRTARQDPEAA